MFFRKFTTCKPIFFFRNNPSLPSNVSPVILSIVRINFSSFIPKHQPSNESDIYKVHQFLVSYKSDILILTGAGISTESGIPDYRSKDVGLYARSNHKPMTYQEFSKNPAARQRYWARSFIAWPRFSSVKPNDVHNTLVKLEKLGYVSQIVTQNVDRLHHKAGSERVTELHGTLYEVICVGCQNYVIERNKFQEILNDMNPNMKGNSDFIRPDGDVELNMEEIKLFKFPNCPKCNGYLKPNVVFFGENVPSSRTKEVWQIVDECNAVLVLGSSLTVNSAYRIVFQAAIDCKPIYLVNIGDGRGDHLATVHINARCGEILPKVFNKLVN